jgi:hypothetical protein
MHVGRLSSGVLGKSSRVWPGYMRTVRGISDGIENPLMRFGRGFVIGSGWRRCVMR